MSYAKKRIGMVYLVILVFGVAILSIIAFFWFVIALLYLIITSSKAEKQNENEVEIILKVSEEINSPLSLKFRAFRILTPPVILITICIFLNIYISPLGGPY